LRTPSVAREAIAEQSAKREGQLSNPHKQALLLIAMQSTAGQRDHKTASDKGANHYKNILICRSHPHKIVARTFQLFAGSAQLSLPLSKLSPQTLRYTRYAANAVPF
jgi:hypothetical protein